MVVVLIAWIVLALLLGALIGRAIHRADVVQFPGRPEHAPWSATPSRPTEVPADRPSVDTDRAAARAA